MIKKLSIALLFGFTMVGLGVAQDAVPVAQNRQAIGVQGQLTTPAITTTFPRFNDEARKLNKKIQEAAKKFRTTDGLERQDAREVLEAALSEEYDLRLTKYAEHLDQMEAQLEEMRKKLARRREAKSEMVELRIQVLAAEADDLGWPSATPGRRTLWTPSSGLSGFRVPATLPEPPNSRGR